mgnify:CR=1 FL=1
MCYNMFVALRRERNTLLAMAPDGLWGNGTADKGFRKHKRPALSSAFCVLKTRRASIDNSD